MTDCFSLYWIYTVYVWLTIWDSGASLTLHPQRRPKSGPIIEAPALLHFGRAPPHQLGTSHHIIARGTSLPVTESHLSALHALSTRTCHPYPLFKTQLLTVGMTRRKEKRRRGEGCGGMERKEERKNGSNIDGNDDPERKRWNRGKWVKEEGDKDTYRHKKREKKGTLSTPISPQRLRRVQNTHSTEFCLCIQPKHHQTSDMLKISGETQIFCRATNKNPQTESWRPAILVWSHD